MTTVSLSSVVRANPRLINASLEKLSCTGQGVTLVDIYPSVLSALTASGAPACVAEEARAVVQAARRAHQERGASSDDAGAASRDLAPSARLPLSGNRSSGAAADDSYMDNFNVGIAMSLHTVLLSRNSIASLLGIVQFKHCVRLSLLGNRIRTIEDCEPLSLLQDLQFLSLEYNPVTQLPHYRAHMLRITTWPQELTPRACRLRKLDSTAVTTAEVRHAVLCLQREASLLPELLYRTQLLAFLVDVEKRQRVHREMRQRGHLLQDPTESVKVDALLERGVAHALSRVSVAGAAHMARQLVRDRRHLRSDPTPCTTAAAADARGCCQDAAEANGSHDATSTTVTYFGSDELDVTAIDSVSSVVSSSCSLLSHSPAEDAAALHSLSQLMACGELEWSRRSLRRADASAAARTCKTWSTDVFRQTIAALDVRLCSLLLRVSRVLGQTLTSQDVDRLCDIWLHAVTHCVAAADSDSANATGPRRLVTNGGVRSDSAKSASPHRASAPAQTPRHCRLSSAAAASSGGRLPVEAAAPVRVSVWKATTSDPQCLSDASSASTAPPLSDHGHAAHDDASKDSCADVSATSLSSADAVALAPRATPPVPAARPRGARALTSTPALADADRIAQSSGGERPTMRDALDCFQRRTGERCRRRALAQWRTAVRHRCQTRIAVAFVREKVSDGAVSHLRSPSWGGLLLQVTYTERKRGFFAWWRRRAQLRQDCRTVQLRFVWGRWRRKAAAVSLLRVQSEEACLVVAQRTRGRVFRRWCAKAELLASARCEAARRRVMVVDATHSPDTFLSLRSPTPRTAHPVARTPSPPITVLRHRVAASANTLETVLRTATPTPTPPTARADTHASDLAGSIVKCVWRASTAAGPLTAASAATAAAVDVPLKEMSVSDNGELSPACTTPEDNDAGLSVATASPSPGISASSCALSPLHFATSPEWSVQPQGQPCAQSSHLDASPCPMPPCGAQRHLTPPPAIRALFPAGGTRSLSCDPMPAVATAAAAYAAHAAVVWTPLASSTTFRLCGSSGSSRLPSTSAARKAIVQTRAGDETGAPPADTAVPPLPPSGASPYPAADVEALVAQAKELEAERDALADALCELHDCTAPPHAPPPVPLHSATPLSFTAAAEPEERATSPLFSPPPRPFRVVDSLEEKCEAREREVRRLELFVAALQDERHRLLETLKEDLFRY